MNVKALPWPRSSLQGSNLKLCFNSQTRIMLVYCSDLDKDRLCAVTQNLQCNVSLTASGVKLPGRHVDTRTLDSHSVKAAVNKQTRSGQTHHFISLFHLAQTQTHFGSSDHSVFA